MEIEKDKRIKKELRRLKTIFKDLDKDKMKTAKSLLENAAFMSIVLEDLQEVINKDGTVIEYKNGANQYGTKESPEVKIYNTMIKNQMAIMKQLTDMLPKEEAKKVSEDDGFEKFINSRAD